MLAHVYTFINQDCLKQQQSDSHNYHFSRHSVRLVLLRLYFGPFAVFSHHLPACADVIIYHYHL